MRPLTDEQKREYLEHWGCYCPWCGSQDLTVGDIDPDSLGDGGYRQFMQCDSCGRKWQDCYDLVDVLEVDEEETEEQTTDQDELAAETTWPESLAEHAAECEAKESGNLVQPVTPAEVSEDQKGRLF